MYSTSRSQLLPKMYDVKRHSVTEVLDVAVFPLSEHSSLLLREELCLLELRAGPCAFCMISNSTEER